MGLARNYGLSPRRLGIALRLTKEHFDEICAAGPRTSSAEVTNVSPTGVWVLVDQREIFLAFTDFPWFADATIRQVTRLERPSPHHLYWPELDVDLAVESLEEPTKYPLVSQAWSNKRLQPSKARVPRRGGKATRARPRG